MMHFYVIVLILIFGLRLLSTFVRRIRHNHRVSTPTTPYIGKERGGLYMEKKMYTMEIEAPHMLHHLMSDGKLSPIDVILLLASGSSCKVAIAPNVVENVNKAKATQGMD